VGGGAQTTIDEHDLFLFASGVLLHRDYCCPRALELFLQEQCAISARKNLELLEGGEDFDGGGFGEGVPSSAG
jgi:hypothetical protein